MREQTITLPLTIFLFVVASNFTEGDLSDDDDDIKKPKPKICK